MGSGILGGAGESICADEIEPAAVELDGVAGCRAGGLTPGETRKAGGSLVHIGDRDSEARKTERAVADG